MPSDDVLEEVLEELRAVKAKFDELLQQADDEGMIYYISGNINTKLDKILQLLGKDPIS